MAIGLTDAEEQYLSSVTSTDGQIDDEIADLDLAIASTYTQGAEDQLREDANKKFYDFWTRITTYSESEIKWTAGEYVTSPVTESDITLTAQGEENQLYPIESESWFNSYPKRVAALYGPDGSNYGETSGGFPVVITPGPYEYAQIDKELASTGILDGADRAAAQVAQRDALQDYTIPALTSLISEASSESTRYTSLSTIVSQATTALALANTALLKVQAEIDGGSPLSPVDPTRRTVYLPARKAEITSRSLEASTTFADYYTYRYNWLNERVNNEYGSYSDTLETANSLVFLQAKKSALLTRKNAYESYLG